MQPRILLSVHGGKARKIRFCIKWKNLSEPVMVHPFWTRRRYRYIFHAHKSQTEVNQRNSYIIDMSLTGKDRVSIGGGLIRPEVVK